MSAKKILILLGVFVALLLVATYPQWSSLVMNPPTDKVFADAPDFSAFTKETLTKFTIAEKNAMRDFAKTATDWKINDKAVANNEIEIFFEELGSTKPLEIASKNPENDAKLGLTIDTGLLLTIEGAEPIFIGLNGPQPATFFAKKQGAQNAFLYSGTLSNKIRQPADAWRDKTIVDFDAGSIASIIVTEGKQQTTFLAQQPAATPGVSPNVDESPSPAAATTWIKKIGSNETALDATVSQKISALFHPLAASGFLTTEEIATFDATAEGKISVQIIGNDGAILTNLSILKHEKELWGKPEAGDAFRMPTFRFEPILTPEGKPPA